MFPQILPKVYSLKETQLYMEAFYRDGYIVIDDLPLSPQDVKEQFVNDMKHVAPGITLENMWTIKQGQDYPESCMLGLIGEYGMSQCDSAWMVRTNSGIQEVFRNLLGDTDLVCSMDAIGYSTDNEGSTGRVWLHQDQNKSIPGGETLSIQSIYYAEDIPEDPEGSYACTVVVPGSHDVDSSSTSKSHFCMTDDEDIKAAAVRLRMKAGQLLVFNSYLVHQGWHGRHRLCYMVSYGLKKDRTEAVRRRKVLMYLCGHRSTHWSQLGQLHGYKYLPEESQAWPALRPTLTGDLLDWAPFEYDMYYIGDKWYLPDFDGYIPENRLVLL